MTLICLALLPPCLPALHAQCPDGTPPPCGPRRPTPISVVVLAFESRSPDSADAYLADGIAEEIATRLGSLQRFRVRRTGRSGLRRMRDTIADAPQVIGRVLQVRYLIEGSVRSAGSRLRVSVRVVRTSDGLQVWSRDYNRTSGDLLALESDLSQAAAEEIAGRLAPSERARLAASPTRDSVAYDRYLRGNAHLAARTPNRLSRAIVEYEEALRRDGRFAAARGRLAYTYALLFTLRWHHPTLPLESLRVRARREADVALAGDSGAADAWSAQGLLLTEDRPDTYEGVLEAFARAVALDPANAEAHHQLGVRLWFLGRDSASRAELLRALELDPRRAATLSRLALHAVHSGLWSEAVRWADSSLAQDPDQGGTYTVRAEGRFRLGDTVGVRSDLELAARLESRPVARVWQARLALADGDTATARAQADSLAPAGTQSTRPSLAVLFVELGNYDRALDQLSFPMTPDVAVWRALRSHNLHPLWSLPAFQRLVVAVRPPGAAQ